METISIIEDLLIPLGHSSSGLDSNFADLFLSSVQDPKRIAKILIIFLKDFVLFPLM